MAGVARQGALRRRCVPGAAGARPGARRVPADAGCHACELLRRFHRGAGPDGRGGGGGGGGQSRQRDRGHATRTTARAAVAADARAIAEQTRFHPVGRRPFDGSNADGDWLLSRLIGGEVDDQQWAEAYLAHANENKFVMVHLTSGSHN